MPASVSARAGSSALTAIGFFKLGKALLFIAAAIGVFSMVHRDTQVEIKHLLQVFRINGDRVAAKELLAKANLFDAPKKKLVSGILAFYAALFATEGTGLLLKKRWAEYFTVILTGTGIPIELYAIWRKVDGLKLAALAINVFIVWFLIFHLSRGWRAHKLLMEQLAQAPPTAEEVGAES